MRLTLFILSLLSILATGCAKRGSITGGLKDTIPPTLRQSMPPNYSTDFKGNTIKLTFDEYVKLKDANKQLIISPPANRAPIITPSTASKTLSIRLMDTLQPNTTYSLNFGQSIQDNNEGNPYPQFKYVFSTGSYIDSLLVAGRIKDAYDKTTDNNVSIMLYEVDETYSDSIIYKQPPRYITRTQDTSNIWRLENLKAGNYLLMALKDDNNNNTFNPKSDKIAFQNKFITIPTDTLYELELFKEKPAFRALQASHAATNRIVIGYEGDPRKASAALFSSGQEVTAEITKLKGADSLQLWFRPIKVDSLDLQISTTDYEKKFNVKMRNLKQDTLSFSASTTNILPLRESFKIQSSIPISAIDSALIQVIDKDSASIAFKIEEDKFNQQIIVDFKRDPEQRYNVRLLPGALTSFYGQANDTISYKMATNKLSDYGNLRINLQNVRQFPIIIELTDSKGEVRVRGFSGEQTTIQFEAIDPALYSVRLIYDENANREWDPGNFLQRRQSEQVIHFPAAIEVRANWDVEETFILP